MPVQSATSASFSYGAKVMNVQGPYYGFVRRADPKWGGFDEADRVYRAKWLKDQVFSAKDGKADITRNPDYYKARVNIIRRVFRTPMDMFEEAMRKVTSGPKAILYRGFVSVGLRSLALTWFVAYNCMYATDDWTRLGGFKMLKTRPTLYPGDSDWPNVPKKQPHEYYHNGFYETPFAKM